MLCECGCGQATTVATKNDRRNGSVRGQPRRFVRGHCGRVKRSLGVGPNPGGLCLCGCGRETRLAAYSSRRKGWVKGQPVAFVLGHRAPLGNAENHVVADDGCWYWQGAVSGGYGMVRVGGRAGRGVGAHRIYYEQHIGPIPVGHHLHHLCGNGLCVNPAHLEPMEASAHLRLHRTCGHA
jgi:hypothetical protein